MLHVSIVIRSVVKKCLEWRTHFVQSDTLENKVVVISLAHLLDIVDIKPANMEELTEVITAAQFHPVNCNEFIYSSSKGTIRLCDMREKALCDQHAKCKLLSHHAHVILPSYCPFSPFIHLPIFL